MTLTNKYGEKIEIKPCGMTHTEKSPCHKVYIKGLVDASGLMEREDAERVIIALKAYAAMQAAGIEFADTGED